MNATAEREAGDLDEIRLLLESLPEPLRAAALAARLAELVEVVIDLGRPPEARLTSGSVQLTPAPATREQLQHVMDHIGPMTADNRAGIERTLHRISSIRNRRGEVIGLTMRVGRAVFGTIETVRDLVESGRNILLLGRPGVGKTTKLREMARVLADDLRKRVVVVDTSNEIAGDGDVPHPGIGAARRMQVARPDRQHAVMIEAVENHTPEAILIDEIGTAEEAAAARTIAERGVQLIATAHGTTLENLIVNPTLSDLAGGVHTVTLSDEEARRRRTTKTITERRGPPTFDSIVEIVDRHEVIVHADTADAVDQLLAGRRSGGERRRLEAGRLTTERLAMATAPLPGPPQPPPSGDLRHRIYPHAISRELLARALSDVPADVRIVPDPDGADVILALRPRANERALREAVANGAQLFVLKRNSSTELRKVLRRAFGPVGGVDTDEVHDAIAEAEHAIARVMSEGSAVSLAPRPPELRKAQHRVVTRYHLEAESTGREPMRHLVVFPATSDDRRLELGSRTRQAS